MEYSVNSFLWLWQYIYKITTHVLILSLIHILFSSLLNPFYAFLIGGIGSGLADIAGGYGIYFIPTLFIKGIEAVLVSLLLHKVTKPLLRYGIYALAGVWTVSYTHLPFLSPRNMI